MKFRNTSLIAFGLLSIWYFLTGAMNYTSNPPTGVTGAPGESTCGQCHGGGNYTGTVTISGVPDTVISTHSYTVVLTQTSNAVKGGFELTCLDGSNAKCGTLTAGSGSSVATSNSRQYVRQSTVKSLSGGSVSWSFTWKAPSTLSGSTAKFYFVSLAANGNGGTSGDKLLSGNKTVTWEATSPTTEVAEQDWLNFHSSPNSGVLSIDLLQDASGTITVFDISGKVLLQQKLTAQNEISTDSWPFGICFAQIQTGSKSATKKFMAR